MHFVDLAVEVAAVLSAWRMSTNSYDLDMVDLFCAHVYVACDEFLLVSRHATICWW